MNTNLQACLSHSTHTETTLLPEEKHPVPTKWEGYMDPSINLDMILENIAQYYNNKHTDMLYWSIASTLPVCKSVAHFIDITITNNLTTLQVITFNF